MIQIEVNQDQVREILKKIDTSHIQDAVKTLIGQMGKRGRVIAMAKLKPTDSMRGTDYAQKSMRYDVREMTATVHSVMPDSRALSIEEGRAPGEDVGFKSIARWYEGSLYLSTSSINKWSDPKAKTIYRIKASIKRSGARGKHFISETWTKLNTDLPKDLSRIAKNIEKRWAK
jgi:hypothetical protein